MDGLVVVDVNVVGNKSFNDVVSEIDGIIDVDVVYSLVDKIDVISDVKVVVDEEVVLVVVVVDLKSKEEL